MDTKHEIVRPWGAGETPTLATSIVLYRPDLERLEWTLGTLATAVRVANAARLVARCVLLLTDHTPEPAPQGLVDRWRHLCLPWLDLAYRHDPSNPGYGAGHNAARQCCAEADYFLVANPDLQFAEDALINGLTFLHQHPRLGVIAPAQDGPDGKRRPGCFRQPDPLTLLLRALGCTARHSPRIARYECLDWDVNVPVFNPPLMSGCCLLFRGEAYDRLGGFDPGYFLYFEDFDLSRRAARLGLSAYCPTMCIRHLGGGAARKGWHHRWWFIRSAWRYSFVKQFQ